MEIIKKHAVWFVLGFLVLCVIAFFIGKRSVRRNPPVVLPAPTNV